MVTGLTLPGLAKTKPAHLIAHVTSCNNCNLPITLKNHAQVLNKLENIL